MSKARVWLCTVMLLVVAGGCSRDEAAKEVASKPVDSNFLADQNIWRMQRQEKLTRPDGWTSLIGLHWLELKSHYIGSGGSSGIRLAMGPEKLGLVQREGEHVFFTPEAGVAVTLDGAPLSGRAELKDDNSDAPGKIGFDDGKGVLTLIKRGERQALRVKHADAPTRTKFAGLDYWPADPSWKIADKFVPHAAGKTLPIASIIGTTDAVPNPGAIEFQRDGTTYRIEALDEGDGVLSLIIADRTSGHDSYGAGRYIDAPKPDAKGMVVVDFNQAYNPPCAFTPFATCPLPPPENRLDLAITAGEKRYGQAH